MAATSECQTIPDARNTGRISVVSFSPVHLLTAL
ncbi:hypothetical protein COLO4_33957 [Corchorus olitorius]|uniref:Uncharacterized protein n=1 Tax=Corchorus olitorius TaxID=93759 RepID=A0A1R3GPS4_9ROSI|nr:hypothetical protein COLO4_33957 [Corchorus olitorius]